MGMSEEKPWDPSMFKPGDLIHTCQGYNEIIAEIEDDGTVVTKGGHRCDFDHCCSLPTTRQQIVNYFLKQWGTEEGLKKARGWWDKDHQIFKIIKALKKGKRVFDDRGCLIKEDL